MRTSTYLYGPQEVVIGLNSREVAPRPFPNLPGCSMHNPGYQLRRTPLPRTKMNKPCSRVSLELDQSCSVGASMCVMAGLPHRSNLKLRQSAGGTKDVS